MSQRKNVPWVGWSCNWWWSQAGQDWPPTWSVKGATLVHVSITTAYGRPVTAKADHPARSAVRR